MSQDKKKMYFRDFVPCNKHSIGGKKLRYSVRVNPYDGIESEELDFDRWEEVARFKHYGSAYSFALECTKGNCINGVGLYLI